MQIFGYYEVLFLVWHVRDKESNLFLIFTRAQIKNLSTFPLSIQTAQKIALNNNCSDFAITKLNCYYCKLNVILLLIGIFFGNDTTQIFWINIDKPLWWPLIAIVASTIDNCGNNTKNVIVLDAWKHVWSDDVFDKFEKHYLLACLETFKLEFCRSTGKLALICNLRILRNLEQSRARFNQKK